MSGADIADTLEKAAQELLATAQGIRSGTVSLDANLQQRTRVMDAAKRALAAVQQPSDLFIDLMVQFASLVATRLFIKWGVFEKLPQATGELISYRDLAGAVGAEEGLISANHPLPPTVHVHLRSDANRQRLLPAAALQPGLPGCSPRRGC